VLAASPLPPEAHALSIAISKMLASNTETIRARHLKSGEITVLPKRRDEHHREDAKRHRS
jgi:hypothetical protein